MQGFKAMAAYFKGKDVACSWRSGYASKAEAWAAAHKGCKENGGAECYQFALGSELSEWADKERVNAEYGFRDRDYRSDQVARQQQNQRQQQSQRSGGGAVESFIGGLLEAAPAIIEGFSAGAAIGGTLGGGGGGYSSGRGGGSSACGPLRAHYQQCERSWRNIGGGTTGQAGSFYECMRTYQNAMIAAGC